MFTKFVLFQGAVFDSAPNPMSPVAFLPGLQKSRVWESGRTNLYFGNLGSLWANGGKTASEIYELMLVQHKALGENWRLYNSTPWNGVYMMHEERENWPLLFLYSRGDWFVPWRFVRDVGLLHASRGRRVESQKFRRSGHVAHLKNHPEFYARKVEHFLNSL